MLDDLFKSIEDLSRTDDVDAWFSSSRQTDSLLEVEVSLALAGRFDRRQIWRVRCPEVFAAVLAYNSQGDLWLDDDHALLLPWKETSTEVYVAVKPANSFEVLGQLYQCHFDIFGEWIPFDRFMNQSLPKVLTDGYGLVAKGPSSLIREYEEILGRHGMRPSVFDPKKIGEPTRAGIGSEWEEVDLATPRVLACGSSYIIGAQFDAEQIT